MTLITKTDVAWEGTTPTLMARIVADDDGLVAVQADVSSINKIVVLGSDGSTVVAAVAVTVVNVVYDTLQTDAKWTTDPTGYNFAHQLAATDLPSGGVTYVIQYEFTGTAGGVSVVEFKIQTKENYHS